MENNYTEDIATSSGFVPISSDAKKEAEKGTSGTDYAGGDMHGLRYVPTLINSLEEHFSFTALMASVVGYIIIAACGQMNDVGKYFGYVFFVFSSFVFYKYLNSKEGLGIWRHIFIVILFIIGFLLFLLWLSIIYLEPIKGWMVYIGSLLK